MKWIGSLLFYLCLGTQVSAFVVELDVGAHQLEYEEKHITQVGRDSKFKQLGSAFNLNMQTFFIPDFMYLNLGAQYLGPAFSTNSATDQKMSHFLSTNSIGFVIPTKPLNVSLIGEYYYNSIQTSNNSFGYDDFGGFQFYPSIDFTPTNGRFSLFARFPLIKTVNDRSEFVYGLHVRMGGKQESDSPYLRGATLLKVEYSEVEFEDDVVGPVNYKTKSLKISLGYSF